MNGRSFMSKVQHVSFCLMLASMIAFAIGLSIACIVPSVRAAQPDSWASSRDSLWATAIDSKAKIESVRDRVDAHDKQIESLERRVEALALLENATEVRLQTQNSVAAAIAAGFLGLLAKMIWEWAHKRARAEK